VSPNSIYIKKHSAAFAAMSKLQEGLHIVSAIEAAYVVHPDVNKRVNDSAGETA